MDNIRYYTNQQKIDIAFPSLEVVLDVEDKHAMDNPLVNTRFDQTSIVHPFSVRLPSKNHKTLSLILQVFHLQASGHICDKCHKHIYT